MRLFYQLRLEKTRSILLLFFLLLFSFMSMLPAEAALVGCKKPNPIDCQASDLLDTVVRIYNWLLGSAAAVAMGMLVFAGIRMLLHYASESPEQELEAAKHTIRRAVTGLFIIAAAYMLVNVLLYSVLGLRSDQGKDSVGDLLQKRGIFQK